MPGRGAVQVRDTAVAPAATSVEKDCTRDPWAGGVPAPLSPPPGGSPAIGQVSGWALVWSGLGVVVGAAPSPPPNWPTITSEVGTVLPLAKERLLVRLICRVCPVGTVITTGDQTPTSGVVVSAAAATALLSAVQDAVVPATWVASQL